MEPKGVFAVDAKFEIESYTDNDFVFYRGVTTHVKAIEQEWVTWYGQTLDGKIIEIISPILWSHLPPTRLLEYTILYRALPSILKSLYPKLCPSTSP